MASTKEIEKELKIALKEIGKIVPWYDKRFKAWIFSHSLYPVECSGDTKEEVIEKYPLYIREFILHRLDNRLCPLMENKTKGRGGYRPGSGRPKGTTKEVKSRIYLPTEIAEWLKEKSHLIQVTKLMTREKLRHA